MLICQQIIAEKGNVAEEHRSWNICFWLYAEQACDCHQCGVQWDGALSTILSVCSKTINRIEISMRFFIMMTFYLILLETYNYNIM